MFKVKKKCTEPSSFKAQCYVAQHSNLKRISCMSSTVLIHTLRFTRIAELETAQGNKMSLGAVSVITAIERAMRIYESPYQICDSPLPHNLARKSMTVIYRPSPVAEAPMRRSTMLILIVIGWSEAGGSAPRQERMNWLAI